MATKDLAMLQSDLTGAVVQALATPLNNGYLVSGPLKMVQRFLLELMTPKGSMTYLPNRGSSFVTSLARGAASSMDVLSYFSAAMLDVHANLDEEDEAEGAVPDEERLASAEASEIVIMPGTVRLKIALRNRAGSSFNVSVPLIFNLL